MEKDSNKDLLLIGVPLRELNYPPLSLALLKSILFNANYDVAIADANLHSGSVTFYLDEGNNKLKFKIRYSNGTLKDGEINLT